MDQGCPAPQDPWEWLGGDIAAVPCYGQAYEWLGGPDPGYIWDRTAWRDALSEVCDTPITAQEGLISAENRWLATPNRALFPDLWLAVQRSLTDPQKFEILPEWPESMQPTPIASSGYRSRGVQEIPDRWLYPPEVAHVGRTWELPREPRIAALLVELINTVPMVYSP